MRGDGTVAHARAPSSYSRTPDPYHLFRVRAAGGVLAVRCFVRASHSRLSSLSRDEIAVTASANVRRRENRTIGIFKVDNGCDARTWRVRRTLYALRAKRMFITDTPYGVSFARVLDGWAATTTTVESGNSPIHARRSI